MHFFVQNSVALTSIKSWFHFNSGEKIFFKLRLVANYLIKECSEVTYNESCKQDKVAPYIVF